MTKVQKVDYQTAYVPRCIDAELDDLLASLPALLLDGPKGVGKTATATPRSTIVHRLDRTAEAQPIEADPDRVAQPGTVLLDEWQRVPEVWDAVRRQVDDDPRPSQFILTGSAPSTESHSGAARIANVRMRPLTIQERLDLQPTVSMKSLLEHGELEITGESQVQLDQYVEEIVGGGFPGMRHLSGRALRTQLDSYLKRIVDHDIPLEGYRVRRPESVFALMRAYAAATSTTTSFEKIRRAAASGQGELHQTTASPYVELLTALRILDPIRAWLPTRNHLNKLTQADKHHLADPALAVRLVDLDVNHLLSGDEPNHSIVRDGTFLGALFESLCALSVRVAAQACEARVRHLRLQGGRREVDFIVERGTKVVGFEAKLSATVKDDDVKHLLWLKGQLGKDCADLVVLTTGPTAYRRADGVAVVPLALLGP